MMGEKTNAQKIQTLQKIGALQIDPESRNIAEKQIDFFSALWTVQVYIHVYIYIHIYIYLNCLFIYI